MLRDRTKTNLFVIGLILLTILIGPALDDLVDLPYIGWLFWLLQFLRNFAY